MPGSTGREKWQHGKVFALTGKGSEVPMFEFESEIVDALVADDESFERLYNKHHTLKEQVRDAEIGILSLDEYELGNLKKEKLVTKDRMASMIEDYKRVNTLS